MVRWSKEDGGQYGPGFVSWFVCSWRPDITRLHWETVSEDTNDLLCKDFSDEEIGDALFQIGPHKAPGHDGFLDPFFQRNWRTIKVDVIQAVKRFFRDGVMTEEVNDTNVVVIPKVPHPKTLTYFRPISSCNVTYKIVLKCLVNRHRSLSRQLKVPLCQVVQSQIML